MTACTCGNPEPHRIAKRVLGDGRRLELWSDGVLCSAFGFIVRGSPRPRTMHGLVEALRAGWLVMGECEIFDFDDIEELISAARLVAGRGGSPGDVRALFWSRRRDASVPMAVWAPASSGERWWVLPRLSRLRGLAVLDTGKSGRRRFRVMNRVATNAADETFETTGFEFQTLASTREHLANTVAMNSEVGA